MGKSTGSPNHSPLKQAASAAPDPAAHPSGFDVEIPTGETTATRAALSPAGAAPGTASDEIASGAMARTTASVASAGGAPADPVAQQSAPRVSSSSAAFPVGTAPGGNVDGSAPRRDETAERVQLASAESVDAANRSGARPANSFAQRTSQSERRLDTIVPTAGVRVIAGKYELIRPIAEGGMSTVWLARHKLTRSEFALKLLSPDFTADEAGVERFLREVRFGSEIGHPGIVAVHDAGEDDDGTFYIAMELLVGESFERRLESSGTTILESVGWLVAALDPLRHAHAHGIVHRDLKPDNLFLSVDREGGEVLKIIDFGIARQIGVTSKTTDGAALGTVSYMSPEQASNARDVRAAADIWAVGVMLYQALTGVVPFEGETVHEVVIRLHNDPHIPVRERAPFVPHALAAVVERCLAKDPAERPADASELYASLAPLLRDPQVTSALSRTHTASATGPESPASSAPDERAGGAGSAPPLAAIQAVPSEPPIRVTASASSSSAAREVKALATAAYPQVKAERSKLVAFAASSLVLAALGLLYFTGGGSTPDAGHPLPLSASEARGDESRQRGEAASDPPRAERITTAEPPIAEPLAAEQPEAAEPLAAEQPEAAEPLAAEQPEAAEPLAAEQPEAAEPLAASGGFALAPAQSLAARASENGEARPTRVAEANRPRTPARTSTIEQGHPQGSRAARTLNPSDPQNHRQRAGVHGPPASAAIEDHASAAPAESPPRATSASLVPASSEGEGTIATSAPSAHRRTDEDGSSAIAAALAAATELDADRSLTSPVSPTATPSPARSTPTASEASVTQRSTGETVARSAIAGSSGRSTTPSANTSSTSPNASPSANTSSTSPNASPSLHASPRRAAEPATSFRATPALEHVAIRGLNHGDGLRALQHAMDLYRECYESRARAAGRSPRERVQVSLVVDERGLFRDVRGAGGTLRGLASCVAQATSRVRSSARPDIGRASIDFELDFRPE